MFKFTIVTVVYNAEDLVEDTIKSVLNQSYKDFEYIIIDGNSKDRTLEIVNKYSNDINLIISEPDGGIYDAMNKAIKLAKGKYINFLNAGDTYINSDVLGKVSDIFTKNDYSLLYGLASMTNNNKTYYIGRSNISKIKICHQAAFYKTTLHKEYGLYDTSFKIIADRFFFTKIYLKNEPFLFIDEVFVNYLYDGVTHNFPFKRIKEELLMDNYYYKNKFIFNYLKYLIKYYYFKLKKDKK